MIAFGNQHAFDASAVAESEQEFFGAIDGRLVLDKRQTSDRKGLGQCRPQRLAQVAHGIERVDLVAINPAPDLIGAIGRFTLLLQPLVKGCPVHIFDVLVGVSVIILFAIFSALGYLWRKHTPESIPPALAFPSCVPSPQGGKW